MAKTLQWLNECKDVIYGYPTVVRFSSEIIQKILFFECARIHWFDIYNLNKGVKSIDKGAITLNEDLEALKHTWPLKKYFKKQSKKKK